jgi:hypothetical protein
MVAPPALPRRSLAVKLAVRARTATPVAPGSNCRFADLLRFF